MGCNVVRRLNFYSRIFGNFWKIKNFVKISSNFFRPNFQKSSSPTKWTAAKFFAQAKQKQNCQKAKAWNAIKSLQIDWIYYWKFFFSPQRHTNLQSPRAPAMLSLLPDPITRRLRQQSWGEPNFAFYFWLTKFLERRRGIMQINSKCLSFESLLGYWVEIKLGRHSVPNFVDLSYLVL